MEDEFNGKERDEERVTKRKCKEERQKRNAKKYARRHSDERFEGLRNYAWKYLMDEVEKEEEK